MECVFCRIISGEIPSEMLYQDEQAVAFRDIHPQAPVHILVVPRKHISTPGELTEEEFALIGHLVRVAELLARREKIAERGYRLVINVGKEGTQTIPHLHLHLLGGRRLSDQMG